ncbi:hypothetical protein BROUX41_001136 [Berkeleyomyces rouxiae]
MAQPPFILSNRRLLDQPTSGTITDRKANPLQFANPSMAAVSTPRTHHHAEVSRLMSTMPLDELPRSPKAAAPVPVAAAAASQSLASSLNAGDDVNAAGCYPRNSASSAGRPDLAASADATPQDAQRQAPANFGIVAPAIYRSDFPATENLSFLATLGLKTIVTLVKKDKIDPDFARFMAANGISHRVIDMEGTKKKAIPAETMAAIMDIVCDERNQPVLVHCNHGKHRTGCVIGVLRHLSGWSVNDILTEYKLYAGEKARDCDLDYLASFDVRSLSPLLSSSDHHHHYRHHNKDHLIRCSASPKAHKYSRALHPLDRLRHRRPRLAALASPVFLAFVMILIWSTTYYRLAPPAASRPAFPDGQ